MCKSCEMLTINGVACHETGCPDAWKDYKKDCAWCGEPFTPETKHQECCSEDCAESYNN